jgi:adenylosuccinate synthase
VRRVARFNMAAVLTACRYNRPTTLAIMGLDRWDYGNYLAKREAELTTSGVEFIQRLETETKVSVRWIGTGFGTTDVIGKIEIR